MKLTCFSLTVVLSTFLIFCVVTPRLDDNLLTFSPLKNIVIVGDSYTACAIDDSLFKRSTNLSFVAEPYLYSYIKLKKILPLNPHIDTVFIGFSSISINAYADDWYTGSGPISKRLPAHWQFMNVNELYDVFRTNPNGFSNAFVSNYKSNIKNFIAMKNSSSLKEKKFGGYNFSKKMMTTEILMSGKEMERTMSTKYSSRQINYLRMILDICEENHVKPILLVTPIHASSPKNLQKVFYLLYESEFSDIDILDYSKFSLPDSCFGDLHHLNYKGARVFSNYLEKL